MIPPIIWIRTDFDESPSPFLRGKTEQPLKITFHTSSFAGAPSEEIEAIEALRQLSNLTEIDAIDTESGGPLFHLETATLENGEARQWSEIAAHLTGQTDPLHPEVQAMLADLLVVKAHCRMRQDILVTLSHQLLSHRTRTPVHEANPRTPSEAAQIVGLFLRSRNNYTWRANQRERHSFDRGLFYWVLVRHRLPSMWRYFSACVYAEAIRRDDTLYLGQSILERCFRSLEARDAIGIQFYIPQNNNTRDTIMYHFDYLTLLLAGAFDAQARIARRAYRIEQPNERMTGFRRQEFLNALRNHGANALYNIVSGQYYQDLMTLLHELRNTIHGAGLPTLSYQDRASPEQSFVTILSEHRDALWRAAERCGLPEKWGLIRMHEALFEPYTYAVTLVDECFRQIDAITAATDVTRLFPDEHAIPPLQDGPPDDNVFGEHIRKRLAILG